MIIVRTVIKGKKRGRTLGFPTINFKVGKLKEKFPFGVYKCKISIDGCQAPNVRYGALFFGKRSTFGENNIVLEIHIPGIKNNLYGKKIKIKIGEKIRNNKKFKSAKELKTQIGKDIKNLF